MPSLFPNVRSLPEPLGDGLLYVKEWIDPEGKRASTRSLFVIFELFKPDTSYQTLFDDFVPDTNERWKDVAQHVEACGLRFRPTELLPDKKSSVRICLTEYFLAVHAYHRRNGFA